MLQTQKDDSMFYMKNIFSVLIFTLLLQVFSAGVAAPTSAPVMPTEGLISATVDHVVDGDTAWFWVDGEKHKVRFIGMDTPETVHPNKEVEAYGLEASAFTKCMLPEGLVVYLEYDVETLDRYDRDLCYIWLKDGSMLNYTLVLQGYAQVATFPPNVKYVDYFLSAQREAVEVGSGLWKK